MDKIHRQSIERDRADGSHRGYESLLVARLHQNNSPLAVVNPRQVRDFARGIGRDEKTDPIDAQVIVRFGAVVQPAPQPAKSDEQIKLGALVVRR